jgi:transposase
MELASTPRLRAASATLYARSLTNFTADSLNSRVNFRLGMGISFREHYALLCPRPLFVGNVTISNSSASTPAVWVGIDIAKDKFDVHIRPLSRQFTFANDVQGFAQLVDQLHLLPALKLIVLEASGGYERSLVGHLIDADLPVSVVNPRQVRDFAKCLGLHAKTDAIDAAVLAHFAELIKTRLATKTPENQQELQDLVTRRRQLIQLRTMEQNRQHMAHGRHGNRI